MRNDQQDHHLGQELTPDENEEEEDDDAVDYFVEGMTLLHDRLQTPQGLVRRIHYYSPVHRFFAIILYFLQGWYHSNGGFLFSFVGLGMYSMARPASQPTFEWLETVRFLRWNRGIGRIAPRYSTHSFCRRVEQPLLGWVVHSLEQYKLQWHPFCHRTTIGMTVKSLSNNIKS